eukprot:PhM_4_TR11440/c0_g1_i1/m.63837
MSIEIRPPYLRVFLSELDDKNNSHLSRHCSSSSGVLVHGYVVRFVGRDVMIDDGTALFTLTCLDYEDVIETLLEAPRPGQYVHALCERRNLSNNKTSSSGSSSKKKQQQHQQPVFGWVCTKLWVRDSSRAAIEETVFINTALALKERKKLLEEGGTSNQQPRGIVID